MKIKNIQLIAIIIIGVVFFISCGEEVLKQRPQIEPPIIETQPTVTDVSYSSAQVSWVTDVPCSTHLKYWISGVGDTLSVINDEFRQVHKTLLDSLIPESDYEFSVKCVNQFDNFSESSMQTFTTLINYNDLITTGWQRFEAGDFSGSFLDFSDFLSFEPDNFNANLGAAWSQCRAGNQEQAIDYFVECLGDSANQLDAVSGITLAAYQQNYYTDVIQFGSIIHNQALNFWAGTGQIGYNPADSLYYVFEHDTRYDNLDISLMLADSYFQSGNNTGAKGQIDFLLPMYGLHESDTSSWVVNFVVYDTYTEALGALVDSLKTDYWINGENP